MESLPKGFLWGNSVSSMQTEGAWDEGGKGLSVYDIRKSGHNRSDWKVATDSYHQYITDFDLMKDLGMNCYRFQISWSRVVPNGDGDFNEEGIAFYDQFIDELLARGIEPMICLYHFDMPLELAENYNGFTSRTVKEAFVRFGREMMDRFSHKVKYWLSFNEPNLCQMADGFQAGGYLKGEKTLKELYSIQHFMTLAHAELSNYLKSKYPSCLMGGMLAYMEIYPATSKPEDVFAARKADEFYNQSLLRVYSEGKYSQEVLQEMKNYQLLDIITTADLIEIGKTRNDFVAFSYYYSTTIDAKNITNETPVCHYLDIGKKENPYIESTEWKWQIDAKGFRNVMNKIYAKTNLPVFPIENGIGVIEEWNGADPIEDEYRIAYHRDHLQAMKEAYHYDGIPLMGYLGWGLIDILSSQGDMRKRYGIVYVNRDNHDLKDLQRVPKKSFSWFKKVIASNGENLN